MVKTTLNLPDELYRKAKATAALRGESLTSLLTEALERVIDNDGPLPDAYEPVSKKAALGSPRGREETPAEFEARMAKWREETTAMLEEMRGPDDDTRSSVEIIREGRR